MNEIPDDLDALDAWLAAREAALGDVRDEADARIVWADERRQRTDVAIVYLHGFSATRMETAPLSDQLAAHLGANLFYARLAGHGRTPAAMGEATAEHWLEDAREALALGARLGERVILIGCSTGGTLATLLAVEDGAESVAAMVLVAPNYGPKDPRSMLLTWPGARVWGPWLVGAERDIEPESEGHARHWTTRYPTTSLIPMMELVVKVRRAPLERVRTPVLAIFSELDTVVEAGRTAPVLERFDAHVEIEKVAGEAGESNHVIAGDVFAPDATTGLAERILGFLDGQGLAAQR